MDVLRSFNFTSGPLDLESNQFEGSIPDEIERTVSREAEKAIVSPVKSKTFRNNHPSSPIEYTYYDYKVFHILRDFCDQTALSRDAVNHIVDKLPDG